jgi:hypothetical protein
VSGVSLASAISRRSSYYLPTADAIQDWTLYNMSMVNGVFVARVSRKLQTCDVTDVAIAGASCCVRLAVVDV